MISAHLTLDIKSFSGPDLSTLFTMQASLNGVKNYINIPAICCSKLVECVLWKEKLSTCRLEYMKLLVRIYREYGAKKLQITQDNTPTLLFYYFEMEQAPG